MEIKSGGKVRPSGLLSDWRCSKLVRRKGGREGGEGGLECVEKGRRIENVEEKFSKTKRVGRSLQQLDGS